MEGRKTYARGLDNSGNIEGLFRAKAEGDALWNSYPPTLAQGAFGKQIKDYVKQALRHVRLFCLFV
jgi:hypothetical protein